MSVVNRLRTLLGTESSTEQDPLDQLRDLLAEREAELQLRAEFGTPRPNLTDQPTVVFPYTLYTDEGEQYGEGAKEFVLPDDGLKDRESALVKFVGRRFGIAPEDVDFDALADVAGTSSTAELTEDGDVVVA